MREEIHDSRMFWENGVYGSGALDTTEDMVGRAGFSLIPRIFDGHKIANANHQMAT